MTYKVLVTGGLGFIGSNFIRFALERHPDWEITNLDNFSETADPDNVRDIMGSARYHFALGDITDRFLVDMLLRRGFDVLINFGAEPCPDFDSEKASRVIKSNVDGVHNLIESAREFGTRRFIQISTFEVYGPSSPQGGFTEDSPLRPVDLFAVSKASAELMCSAAVRSDGLPIIITRSSLNYGPYQSPSEFFPAIIRRALKSEGIPASPGDFDILDWIYVLDHCRALDLLIEKGRAGEIYNVGSGDAKTRFDVAKDIIRRLGKPEELLEPEKASVADGTSYLLDTSKITRELGFRSAFRFEEAIARTVRWYLERGHLEEKV
jgi:dTDP-glucose 4,6-dehydratase